MSFSWYSTALLLPRHLIALLILFAGVCLGFAFQAHAGESTDLRIVYVNSYSRGYSWSDGLEDALRRRLAESGKQIEVSSEYLDSRRFGYGAQIEPLAQAMAIKYAKYRPDLVIVSDNAAFDFAIQHRARLFPGLPIVFTGYNNFRPEVIAGFNNITGVNEEIDIEGTVDMATRVHPTARTLAFVISTGDPSSQRIAQVADQLAFPRLRERFQVVAMKDATIEEIKTQLIALPKDTLVFLSGQTVDRGKGRALTPLENGSLITAVSPFPTYTFWDFHLGRGAVGGHIITGGDQGRAAAELALRVLNGEAADSIPVIMKTPTRNVFDYQAMRKFGVSPSDLPSEAQIDNRPPSIWENFKYEVMFASAVILVLLALVVALGTAIRRRRSAEMAVRGSESKLMAANDQLTVLNTALYDANRELTVARDAAEAANRAKTAFLANMGHELRTPMNGVLGMVGMALKRQADPKASHQLQVAQKSAERLLAVLNDVLDFARLEADHVALEFAEFELSPLLESVRFQHQDEALEKNLSLRVVLLPETAHATFLGDPVRLRRVVGNLVGNAIKFSDDGEILLRVLLVEEDERRCLLRFEVEDHGIGMDVEERARLFNAFEQADVSMTRKYGGAGLGLAICKRLVEMMEGEIGVISAPGQGSTFWFTARLQKVRPASVAGSGLVSPGPA